MHRISYRARWATLVGMALAGLLVGACDWKKTLLDPQNPGTIDESAVSSKAAALALKVGAMGRLKLLVNCGGGECLWQEGGHLADEYKNSDFQPSRQDIDMRSITTSNNTLNYNTVTTIRGYIRTALNKMFEFLPDSSVHIGELYLAMGFVEMSMSETYCSGIPLGRIVNGEVNYADPSFRPLTNAEVYDAALGHVDSALVKLGTATDVSSIAVRNAALITKARILLNKGQFAAAAALVPTSTVSTNYQ